MNKYDVGVITDGEAGRNLAFDLSASGYSTVLYNTGLDNMARDEMNRYIAGIQEMGILASTSSEMTVNLLKSPKILFVVKKADCVYRSWLLRRGNGSACRCFHHDGGLSGCLYQHL